MKLNKCFGAEVCVYFPFYGITCISLRKMALQLSSQESLAQVSEKGTKITLLYKTLYPMQPSAKLHNSWLTQLFHKSKQYVNEFMDFVMIEHALYGVKTDLMWTFHFFFRLAWNLLSSPILEHWKNKWIPESINCGPMGWWISNIR